MGWGESGQDGAGCPIAEGVGHNGRSLTLDKQPTALCPVKTPMRLKTPGRECHRTVLSDLSGYGAGPLFHQPLLPQTLTQHSLVPGPVRRAGNIFALHPRAGNNRLHWREGAGGMKVVPTHSPCLGTELGNYQRRGGGWGVCNCDFFPSGGEQEELG